MRDDGMALQASRFTLSSHVQLRRKFLAVCVNGGLRRSHDQRPFLKRHVGPCTKDVEKMLESCGLKVWFCNCIHLFNVIVVFFFYHKSMDELISKTVPKDISLQTTLQLEQPFCKHAHAFGFPMHI